MLLGTSSLVEKECDCVENAQIADASSKPSVALERTRMVVLEQQCCLKFGSARTAVPPERRLHVVIGGTRTAYQVGSARKSLLMDEERTQQNAEPLGG